MTASLASLQRRADRLKLELARRAARAANYAPTTAPSVLPGVDDWPSFARRTWIRTAGTVAPFDPYPYQENLIETINKNPNVIVNKSRQTGISETICNYLLCRALTERGFAAVIFSKSQQASSDLGRRVRAMANSIKNEQISYLTDSNTQISIEGRGTLYFLPATARAARGIPSCSVLFLDEAAFLEGAEEIYQGSLPTLSMVGENAKVIIVSTPNTETDFYGRLWHADAGAWQKVSIHWSQHPIYGADKDWARKTRESRRLSVAAFNQEYELQFGQTDAQIYPPKLIDACATGAWRECGVVNRDYVLGIDPNAGGNDYFVAVVLDITAGKPAEVVALYRENGRSTEYSLKKVEALLEDFMPSKTIVEKNGMGQVIAEALALQQPKYQIETFTTSRPSKITATDRILYLMENKRLVFPPGIIADELKAFRQLENGAREAAPGYHDDTVLALAFACSLIPDTPSTAGFFAHI